MKIMINEDSKDQRLDRFLRKYFKSSPDIKLADIYSSLRKKDVMVNKKKKKGDYRIHLGDEVEIKNKHLINKFRENNLNKEEKVELLSLDTIEARVRYQDNNWLVFDKPAGILMHGGTKNTNTVTMNDYLQKYIGATNVHSTFKASFGYRLDKNTSGVLVAAKNYIALQYINKLNRDRLIDKEYYCIVVGKSDDHGIINTKLEKVYDKKFNRSKTVVAKTGVEAKTEFWAERYIDHPTLGGISLLRIKLYTGRMHQIRVHLANQGYPILGDIVYGNPAINRKLYKSLKINRQILHCSVYSFKDLDGQKISFEAKLPKDFDIILSNI